VQANPRPLNQETCSGSFLHVVCVDPTTVCAPESLLVAALRSVGVPLSPAFPFQAYRDGQVRVWRWLVGDKSADGIYNTGDLITWWSDPRWIADNPRHEWAIARAVLHNMALQAREIAAWPEIFVIRHGDKELHLPASSSPAFRAFKIGQLKGEIPMDAVFTEPPPEPLHAP